MSKQAKPGVPDAMFGDRVFMLSLLFNSLPPVWVRGFGYDDCPMGEFSTASGTVEVIGGHRYAVTVTKLDE